MLPIKACSHDLYLASVPSSDPGEGRIPEEHVDLHPGPRLAEDALPRPFQRLGSALHASSEVF